MQVCTKHYLLTIPSIENVLSTENCSISYFYFLLYLATFEPNWENKKRLSMSSRINFIRWISIERERLTSLSDKAVLVIVPYSVRSVEITRDKSRNARTGLPYYSVLHRAFHWFGQAKFAYSGQVLGSSQFSLLHQLPEKNNARFESGQNELKNNCDATNQRSRYDLNIL